MIRISLQIIKNNDDFIAYFKNIFFISIIDLNADVQSDILRRVSKSGDSNYYKQAHQKI